jgi:hypothetical protein
MQLIEAAKVCAVHLQRTKQPIAVSMVLLNQETGEMMLIDNLCDEMAALFFKNLANEITNNPAVARRSGTVQ